MSLDLAFYISGGHFRKCRGRGSESFSGSIPPDQHFMPAPLVCPPTFKLLAPPLVSTLTMCIVYENNIAIHPEHAKKDRTM